MQGFLHFWLWPWVHGTRTNIGKYAQMPTNSPHTLGLFMRRSCHRKKPETGGVSVAITWLLTRLRAAGAAPIMAQTLSKSGISARTDCDYRFLSAKVVLCLLSTWLLAKGRLPRPICSPWARWLSGLCQCLRRGFDLRGITF